MNSNVPLHIERLRRRYGNYSAVSRALGISARTLRRGRNDGTGIPLNMQRFIVAASRTGSLQLVLRELFALGDLDPAAFKKAWRKVHGS